MNTKIFAIDVKNGKRNSKQVLEMINFVTDLNGKGICPKNSIDTEEKNDYTIKIINTLTW